MRTASTYRMLATSILYCLAVFKKKNVTKFLVTLDGV